MKYDIDEELKSLSLFSGSVVGKLYPLINIGYMLRYFGEENYEKVV